MSALKRNRRIWFFVKLTVSVGLIAYLILIVDWERAVKTLGKTDNFPFLIILFLLFGRLGFAAFRWKSILADNEVVFPFWQAYRSYLVGAFYNVLLPGVIGGDVVRIGRCTRRTTCQPGIAIASVLLERISGVLALLIIALLTYFFFPTTLSSLLVIETKSPVTIVAAIGIIIMIVVTLGRRKWLRWLPQNSKGIWGFISSGMRSFGILRGQTLMMVLLLSVLFQGVDIVVTFLLSQMIRLPLPMTVFFAVVPLVYLATMLPISLGGLGVREGTLTFLLAQFDVAPSDAVILSFLVYLTRFVIASPGGLVQLIETLVENKKLSAILKKEKRSESI